MCFYHSYRLLSTITLADVEHFVTIFYYYNIAPLAFKIISRADPGICERGGSLPSLTLLILHPPFPSFLLPTFLPSLSLTLEVGHLIAARGPREHFSSPSGSGWSPTTKRYLVNLRIKISPLVAAIFGSFSGNETSKMERLGD